ncbi:hypothetical protein GCM10027160_24520 [Streptomyces calidiresistens]
MFVERWSREDFHVKGEFVMGGPWARLIVAGVLLVLGALTILGVEGCQRLNAASDTPPAGREALPISFPIGDENSIHEGGGALR